MAYLKPPGFTRRVVNPVAGKLKIGGVEQLTVTGRRTGVPERVPIIPVQVGSRRYLVAPYGVSDWVRNLRAAGGGELLGHQPPVRFQAREVPVNQRAEIIDAYRKVAGRAVERCFRSLPDPGDHPVFEIQQPTEPITGESG
ncbi:nitroreductase/quinone reductase family protein [Amycolatopsis benzoatilytica]|uniref:nitroreductase/quinone reductase family protein n=1 Tax=Amycolatopsis benzoatilytica TaxID=346045 RepID=UPI0003815AD7|nr:nitroreductase/quinone reductase family protein [Amycolatopsis benzoatilytica]